MINDKIFLEKINQLTDVRKYLKFLPLEVENDKIYISSIIKESIKYEIILRILYAMNFVNIKPKQNDFYYEGFILKDPFYIETFYKDPVISDIKIKFVEKSIILPFEFKNINLENIFQKMNFKKIEKNIYLIPEYFKDIEDIFEIVSGYFFDFLKTPEISSINDINSNLIFEDLKNIQGLKLVNLIEIKPIYKKSSQKQIIFNNRFVFQNNLASCLLKNNSSCLSFNYLIKNNRSYPIAHIMVEEDKEQILSDINLILNCYNKNLNVIFYKDKIIFKNNKQIVACLKKIHKGTLNDFSKTKGYYYIRILLTTDWKKIPTITKEKTLELNLKFYQKLKTIYKKNNDFYLIEYE